MPVLAVVLAGGRGRRLGGVDKALVPLAGRPLIAHVTAVLKPQVARIAINANRDPGRFPGYPVYPDRADLALDGPFMGLAVAITCFDEDPAASHLLTVPTDVPFLPPDLVQRLREGLGNAPVAFAATAEGPQPVIALWTRDGAARAKARLSGFAGERMESFVRGCGGRAVHFTDAAAFHNINTPADLAAAAGRLSRV